MGKTIEDKQITELSGLKFKIKSLYLGSGDGKGWWIRRLIRTLYIRRRSSIKETFLSDAAPTKERHSFTAYLGSYLLGLWGLLIALERYASVIKARRMADRGFIVFCDR